MVEEVGKTLVVYIDGQVTLWGICKILVAEFGETGDDEEKLLSILSKRVAGDNADSTAPDKVLDPKCMSDGIGPGDLQTFDDLERASNKGRWNLGSS